MLWDTCGSDERGHQRNLIHPWTTGIHCCFISSPSLLLPQLPSPCHYPHYPAHSNFFFFFFYQKKERGKKKQQQNFTPQNECDLGWTPGKREEKKKLPLLIYFNRTRQNSFLLEINTKPCRICTPYNSKPTAPPPCSSASSSLLQHCK